MHLAAQAKPRVLLADDHLAFLGFETLEQLRQDGLPPTVVFLTMHRDDGYVAAAINGGARGCYPVECFEHPDARNAFQEVCAEHSAVAFGFRAAPHRPGTAR